MRFVVTAITIAFSSFALGEEPDQNPSITVSGATLTAQDIADLLQFDSYKFRAEMHPGERFRISVREFRAQEQAPVVLWSHDFEKVKTFCDGPLCDPADVNLATFRIDFKPTAGPMRGVLQSQEKEFKFSVHTFGCRPSGIHGGFSNPLSHVPETEKVVFVATEPSQQLPLKTPDKTKVRRLLYLTLSEGFTGRPVGNPKMWDERFPRAEIVFEPLATTGEN